MKIAGTDVKDADDKLVVTITKADVRSGAKTFAEVNAKVGGMGLVLESASPAQSRARLGGMLKQYQEAMAAGIRMR